MGSCSIVQEGNRLVLRVWSKVEGRNEQKEGERTYSDRFVELLLFGIVVVVVEWVNSNVVVSEFGANLLLRTISTAFLALRSLIRRDDKKA